MTTPRSSRNSVSRRRHGYLDLLNPKLADRVMSIDLNTPGAIHMIVAVSKAAGGDETNLDAGFDFLKKLRAIKYYKVGLGRPAQSQGRRSLRA